MTHTPEETLDERPQVDMHEGVREPTCQGPACDRSVYALGLCTAHYQQQHRGTPLRPLRQTDGRLESLTLRLAPELIEALALVGPTASVAARTILERWAKRQI